ncbi:hypothetical protein [Streptomyces sirii]|uniref:hypothetical protein n=1 Tax=Streptomyces sirii TaxID=3127701 RepID=UPI003D35C171
MWRAEETALGGDVAMAAAAGQDRAQAAPVSAITRRGQRAHRNLIAAWSGRSPRVTTAYACLAAPS